MSRTTRKAISLTERRLKALELRKSGATFERIGEECKTSRSTAHEDVQTAMRETIQEPADELRRLEIERLDVMWNALYPLATSTGHRQQARAVEQCLSIMDRRAKLIGLDAPTRKIVEVITEDAFMDAVKQLEAEVAALDDGGGKSDAGPAGSRKAAARKARGAARTRA
jgi:hypothetical protein